MRQATFINIKLYIEGTRVILLSCKLGLVDVESLLMGAMYDLLDFESDNTLEGSRRILNQKCI